MWTFKPNSAARLACVAVCAGLGAISIATHLARADVATAPAKGAPSPTDARPAVGAESRLGIVRFIPPAGWQVEQQAGRDARAFVSPDSTSDGQAAIVVLLTQPLGQTFDFRARFDKAVENAAADRSITDRGPVVAGKSRQGCDTLQQTFAYKSAGGQTVRGRLVAARVGDRLAAFWYLASGDNLFDKHAGDMNNLLSSARFEGLPDVAPATGQAAVPPRPATNPASPPELQEIERQKAELRKRLAELESREKRLGGAPPATESTGRQPADPAAGWIDVTDRGPDGAWLRTHFPKRTRLVLTLTPAASGNSEIRTVSCDIDRLPETTRLSGFPSGNYHLTARAITPDDKPWPMKLTLSAMPKASDWADAVEVDPSKGVAIGVTDVPK